MQSGRQRKYPFTARIPAGDTLKRLVCDDCGWIHYDNPKIVVGAVCAWGDSILLCRRAIEPRKGFWTIPAGYMEEKESVEAATAREAREEANADIELAGVLGVYSIPRLSQVQIIYKARLRSPDVFAGPESAEVALYQWADIPWGDLAFPSVRWALAHYREVAGLDSFAARGNPPGETGNY
jgi:ADP-ribose pyrophosphatase YjhB (NUDIX family)